jgi:hypothetical protein
VVLEEQEPPYVIVPASEDENVKSGVVLLVEVVTAVTSASVAAVESTINDVNVSVLLKFPAESVTVIVQFE